MEAEPKLPLLEAEVRPKEEALEEPPLTPAVAQEDLSLLFPGYNLPPSSKRKREKLLGGGGGGQELGVCCVDRRKSKVWNFYSKLGDAYVECNICRKQLSFHNSTTTMREHLVRKHHIKDAFFTSSSSSSSSSSQLRDDQAPEWELSPQESLKRSRLEAGSYPSLESRWEVVVELVVEMIFKDLQPLSVVRDKGFSLLLGFLEPGFRLPSLEKVREVLGSRYQAGKEELQRYLQVAAEEVVVSLEQWSCPQQCQGYVGTAVNLIDGDWRRAGCLLQTRRAGGQGLLGAREELQAALQEFGLTTEAVFCVVHDGPEEEEEEEEEGQELEATSRGWRRLPCAARVLQCCVQAGLEVEEVREALEVARGIVRYFQEDPKASSCLSSKLEAIHKGQVRLVGDVAQRWTSTLEMVEKLLELKWAIMAVLEEQPKAGRGLADHQWKLLQDLVGVLRTIQLAAAFLQEEQNSSISSLLPCAHGLLAAIGAQALGASRALGAVVERIKAELSRRWGLAREQALESPAVVASFLDPRFKELRFLSPGQRSQLHQRVKEMLLELCHPQASSSSSSSSSSERRWVATSESKGEEPSGGCSGEGSSSVYDVLLGKDPAENLPEAQQQLENYLVEPLCRRGADPLQWWRSHQRRFPALARLSRRFLATPATALPPRRAFGTGQDLLEQRRAGLEQESLQQVLFLHHNFDLLEALRSGGSSSSKGGSRELR